MKTAKKIDQWIESEIKSSFNALPDIVKETVKEDKRHILTISETIAMNKGFNVKKVESFLQSFI